MTIDTDDTSLLDSVLVLEFSDSNYGNKRYIEIVYTESLCPSSTTDDTIEADLKETIKLDDVFYTLSLSGTEIIDLPKIESSCGTLLNTDIIFDEITVTDADG